MYTLVTGCAGFIGFHLCKRLLARGEKIIGLDNLNNYYDPHLKTSRLSLLKPYPQFEFTSIDLSHRDEMQNLFESYEFQKVIHIAAQAGVRYSISHPYIYSDSNLLGFSHLLEGCRQQHIEHLVYASSSSVYGNNQKYPFSESDNVDHPISFYAATKKSNELMAHSYAYLFNLPTTGLRFFTVYGPWGRPDMALFKFTQKILSNQPIDIYNFGNMERDFTYIDDIIDGIVLSLDNPPQKNSTRDAPYRIYNIGSSRPVTLLNFIEVLEELLEKKAHKNLLPLQPGDVPKTYADISLIQKELGYSPKMPLREGMQKFVEWYLSYYAVPNNS